jgi:hypothetical protein
MRWKSAPQVLTAEQYTHNIILLINIREEKHHHPTTC